MLLIIGILLVTFTDASAYSNFDEYEGRRITAIEINFEGTPSDPSAEAEFLSIIKIIPNTPFSAVALRDSLQALFDSERVANARIEVVDTAGDKNGPIRLRFVIQRQVQIGDVKFEIAQHAGVPVTQDELRARLNLSQPGTRLSKQIVSRNADELQVFLRDRGYFNATVESLEQLDASGTRATITYRIVPGEQARVAAFNIVVKGFDAAPLKPTLALQPGSPFTREALGQDVTKIRQAIIDKGNLAPILDDARVVRDAEKTR